MACSKCKNKSNLKKQLYHNTNGFDRGVAIFLIIWSGFAIYGIISLINKIL